jgi:hypothetical protein
MIRGPTAILTRAIILPIVRIMLKAKLATGTFLVPLVMIVSFSILITAHLASAQSFSFPEQSGLISGTGECKDLFIGIANPHWRVRRGTEFRVSAVHPLWSEGGLEYSWQVSNGKVLTGQGTPQLTIRGGGKRTRGFGNLDGFVSISLRVTKPGACSVETVTRLMVGRSAEYNGPANVDEVILDEDRVVRPCPPGKRPFEGNVVSEDLVVRVTTKASDPENDLPTYAYLVSGGQIVGGGAKVDWDLSGLDAGTYTLIAMVQDGYGVVGRTIKKQVVVEECNGCGFIECPTITIAGPPVLEADSVFTANVSGGSQESVTYEWSVVGGEIVEGQGTPSIRVKIQTMPGGSVTIKIGGLIKEGNCISSETLEFDSYDRSSVKMSEQLPGRATGTPASCRQRHGVRKNCRAAIG